MERLDGPDLLVERQCELSPTLLGPTEGVEPEDPYPFCAKSMGTIEEGLHFIRVASIEDRQGIRWNSDSHEMLDRSAGPRKTTRYSGEFIMSFRACAHKIDKYAADPNRL
jgi:hypothetical protein